MRDFGGLAPNEGFQVSGWGALVSDASHDSSLGGTKLLRILERKLSFWFMALGMPFSIGNLPQEFLWLVAQKVALLLTIFSPELLKFLSVV